MTFTLFTTTKTIIMTRVLQKACISNCITFLKVSSFKINSGFCIYHCSVWSTSTDNHTFCFFLFLVKLSVSLNLVQFYHYFRLVYIILCLSLFGLFIFPCFWLRFIDTLWCSLCSHICVYLSWNLFRFEVTIYTLLLFSL